MTSFRNLQQTTGRIISLDGTDYHFFGGTAYLGLLDNPEYIELYKKGIDLLGLNNGTSRTNNVQLGIYQEAEFHLAGRFGFEAAALLSSGYLAGQVAVRALSKGKAVLYAPGSHPALWLDETPLVDGSFDEWAKATVEFINDAEHDDVLVISNCIDNLTPLHFDFSIFREIKPDKKVLLILDDSHGIGILKKNQVSADLSALKFDNIEIVVLASLAKGLGTDSGVVFGNKGTLEKIKKHPIFNGASPTAPAALYALVHGQDLYEKAFERMQSNTSLLASITRETSLNHIEKFPVFSSTQPLLYKHLLQKNIVISSFPYPLATSPLLNRVVVSALHSEADIRHIGEILYSESSLIL